MAGLTVGQFRDWLLAYEVDGDALAALAPGLTPEMVAADEQADAQSGPGPGGQQARVVTRFRDTIGLPGRLSVRLQPNHPTDDRAGDRGLDPGWAVLRLRRRRDRHQSGQRQHGGDDRPAENDRRVDPAHAIPTQSCVLAHVTNQMAAIERGAPVDLVFQSIAGTEAANKSFGINLALLAEAHQAAQALRRGTVGQNVMYFETGQGSCLSAGAHHGVDQQTLEARAYAVARAFEPLLVNTVVGFIGPEYLFDGKQIIRAGLEDHFCGKLLGVPMGCDICYTNHAEADQDDMDTLLTLLGVAGCNYIMGVPGADDVMLNYQSTSFHDSHYLRQVLGLRPAPEFEAWLAASAVMDSKNRLLSLDPRHRLLAAVANGDNEPAP